MTVEERAKRTVDELFWGIGVNPSKETVQTYMIEALRDQIEECAKILDEWAKINIKYQRTYEAEIMKVGAVAVRALAAPKEEIPDGPDDSFDLGGFECNEKQED